MAHEDEVARPARLPSPLRNKYLLASIFIQVVAIAATIWLLVRGVPLLWILAGWLPILLALLSLSGRIAEAREWLLFDVQEDRDRFAAEVLARIRDGGPVPPFSLYLRPFFTDNEIVEPQQRGFLALFGPVGQLLAWLIASTEGEFERELAEAVIGTAPLVGLGIRAEGVGAGRIVTTDEDWREILAALIPRAETIYMVPIGQPSTLDEIRAIAADPAILAKTVFVRPSNLKRDHFAFGPEGKLRSFGKMWDWTRAQLRDALPAFPAFAGGARLFSFAADGGMREWHGDGLFSIHQRQGLRPGLPGGNRKTHWLAAILLTAPLIALMGLTAGLADSATNTILRIFLFLYIVGVGVFALVRRKAPSHLMQPLVVVLAAVLVGSIAAFIMTEVSVGAFGEVRRYQSPDWVYLPIALRFISSLVAVTLVYELQCRVFQVSRRPKDLIWVWGADLLSSAYIQLAAPAIAAGHFQLPWVVNMAIGDLSILVALVLGSERRKWLLAAAASLVAILIVEYALRSVRLPLLDYLLDHQPSFSYSFGTEPGSFMSARIFGGTVWDLLLRLLYLSSSIFYFAGIMISYRLLWKLGARFGIVRTR